MFTELIKSYLKEQAIKQVEKQLGFDPSLLAGKGAEDAIGSLIGGLFHNTQKEDGLKNLDGALEKDHDGSIFDTIENLLQGEQQWGKIVDHVLGNKSGIVVELLAKKLGITTEQAGALVSFVAPMVMGALGKTKKESGLDANGVQQLLQQEQEAVAKNNDTNPLVLQILDKDGDGDVDLNDFLAA